MFDFFIGILFFLSSFSFSDFIEIENCDDDDLFSIVCGFQNPEDLYLSPSKNKIIISEFGSLAPNTQYGEIFFTKIILGEILNARLKAKKYLLMEWI